MGEFGQSILYAWMEISQWNPFVQVIYTNKNKTKNYPYGSHYLCAGQ
jgi:hypothetical protein